MKFVFLFINTLLIHQINVSAQQKQDSVYTLNEISIKAYLNEQPLISIPASVNSISATQLAQKNTQSILPSLNAMSGVKMEERSPGSYRLSIRGSLIRSPFGVRNLKIYYDDFPLSDAGGNTYLNLIDQNSIKNIEILKGPDGSLFGANSGGVVLINSSSNKKQAEVGLLGGSNALFSQHINIQNISEEHDYTINQAYQRGDGYRENSEMKRFFFQTQQKWRYNKNSNLKFSGFYADIDYQTPGGLTEHQMKTNPKLARANAISQQIGIRNQTLFGGLHHELNLSPSFKHIISISGIYTDFRNPFITNYEKRKEKSLALRSYVEWKNKMENLIRLNWNLGGEYQYTTTEIRNFGNAQGNPNGLQAADKINNNLAFLFNRFAFQIGEHFKSEISASINFADYSFKSLDENISSINGEKTFKNKVMPRFSASYLFNPQFSLRGIISKGYSLPTTAEVRASDAKINPNLEPEEGWNHEIGLRWRTPSNRIYVDIAAFYYKLDQAIVRRVNSEDQDFYVNAGGTDQKGLEFQTNVLLIPNQSGIMSNLNWNSAFTLSNFIFRDYTIGDNDFSGNLLTGVPKASIVNSLDGSILKNLSFYLSHQYNGKTSLNDDESVFAKSYHLLQFNLSWQKQIRQQIVEFKVGADNILNESYSLGNDINAFGGRYFNPAAKRNYFAALKIKW